MFVELDHLGAGGVKEEEKRSREETDFIRGGLELEGSLKCFPSKRLRFKSLTFSSF